MARRGSGRAARCGAELAQLERLIERFDGLRVLVIGDVILDEYLWGDADRVSPEAPVPVVRIQRDSLVLGGAGNLLRNWVSLGGQCDFCAVVGEDPAGRQVTERVLELGVDPAGLVIDAARPTSHKTRVVARSQQMLRFDRESREPLSRGGQRRLLAAADRFVERAHGVALADYGKGTLTPGLARGLMRLFGGRGLPVALDPKRDLAPYRGVALAKPNLAEAEQLGAAGPRTAGDVRRLMARLQQRLPGSDIAITRGGAGMTVCEAGGEPVEVATAGREVFDVQGAGDTCMAALWLARLAGAGLREAALIANAAASVVVGKIGTAAASREELRERLPAVLAADREQR